MSSLETTPDSTARRSRELADVLVRLAQSATDERAVASGRAIVDIVAELTDDEDILRGAMLFALLDAHALPADRAEAVAGPAATRIATELQRLGSLNMVCIPAESALRVLDLRPIDPANWSPPFPTDP